MTEERAARPQFGLELRRRRLAGGISLAEFSRRVHYSKSHVSKVENGLKAPGLDFARAADVELQANGSLVALARATNDAGSQLLRQRDAEIGFASDQLIGSDGHPRSTLNAALWDYAATLSNTEHGSEHIIEYYQTVLGNIRNLGQTLGPSVIMPILRVQIRALVSIADAAGSESLKLFRLAARFADYAGWMAQEMGDTRAAVAWTDLAVDFAQAADDVDMVAYAHVRKALIALYHQDPHGTIELARRVQQMGCSSHVKRLAAQREAQGHALNADYQSFLAAISRAEDLFRQEEETSSPDRLGSTKIDNDIELARGWSLYDLGRHSEATEVLESVLRGTSEASVRARARVAARLALALASQRKIARAQEVLAGILVALPSIESATVRADLTQLLRVLRRWNRDDEVVNLMPALSAALMPAFSLGNGISTGRD